ncbi:unnamed protein product [Diatraea saccharalis]|uniref:PHD-type domain-containing protein n=1 Tax=Diatraea saccharalis TaxID=40085 RepID=A0A9N9R919_9NEOP|nr:unnamed protein product [Diatraea saccharalis]
MNEVANTQGASAGIEKPVQDIAVKFPLFPEPTDEDFEDDIGDVERSYYKEKFKDLNTINSYKLHCTACDRHLGSSTRNESRMRSHPMLRTLVCHTCHTFYNSGEFEKGDDGSELYCRWCGQGGQVYCCSDCPHVFCAKCIKRNLGMPKIKEIENTDDWKCFKCKSNCLWDLRALCWALLRYCDLKNKITHNTQDPQLKETYQKHCSIDHSECCRNKARRKEKVDVKSIKKETDSAKKATSAIIPRIPATIQVKKFASINIDESKEKKPQKRPASPVKNKPIFMKNPVALAQCQKIITPVTMPPLKKIRMPMMAPVRIQQDKKPNPFIGQNTYTRIRPKPPPIMPIPIVPTSYNGFSSNNTYSHNSFNNMVVNDNINLSLESLTQGLDMAAVVAMSNNSNNQDDDVVCTPDFPLEPLCEVTEDNTDDDVQCITPAPAVKQIPSLQQNNTSKSTPNYTRIANNLPDVSSDNIIQMTEEDVSVNTQTGGLKFRVDPQTLSSNKMYRLPDGRIFAINSNPSMPGGYSATIVAVTETTGKAIAPKGATYAAKLSAVPSSTPKPIVHSNSSNRTRAKASILRKSLNSTNRSTTSVKECDMSVSVEWYRFNLLEAIDSLEYSLGRLEKLKKQTTTLFLRQRSLEEMRSLHRTLERVLNTSSNRFNEIRENLNKELKQYVQKKTGGTVSDDDDDVEILPDLNDDPIFIDENSTESTINESNETQEVDLTGVGSSDHNTSIENKDDNYLNTRKDVANSIDGDDNNSNSSNNENISKEIENGYKIGDANDEKAGKEVVNRESNSPIESNSLEKSNHRQGSPEKDNTITNTELDQEQKDEKPHRDDDLEQKDCQMKLVNTDTKQKEPTIEKTIDNDTNKKAIPEEPLKEIEKKISESLSTIKVEDKMQDSEMTEGMIDKILKEEEKLPDPEMSEEMIENLLKDDNVDEIENILPDKEMDVV